MHDKLDILQGRQNRGGGESAMAPTFMTNKIYCVARFQLKYQISNIEIMDHLEVEGKCRFKNSFGSM